MSRIVTAVPNTINYDRSKLMIAVARATTELFGIDRDSVPVLEGFNNAPPQPTDVHINYYIEQNPSYGIASHRVIRRLTQSLNQLIAVPTGQRIGLKLNNWGVYYDIQGGDTTQTAIDALFEQIESSGALEYYDLQAESVGASTIRVIPGDRAGALGCVAFTPNSDAFWNQVDTDAPFQANDKLASVSVRYDIVGDVQKKVGHVTEVLQNHCTSREYQAHFNRRAIGVGEVSPAIDLTGTIASSTQARNVFKIVFNVPIVSYKPVLPYTTISASGDFGGGVTSGITVP